MDKPSRKLTSLNCSNGTVVNVRLNRTQTNDLQQISKALEDALGKTLSKTLVLRRSLARYLNDISKMPKELLLDEIKIIKRSFRK